MQLFKPRLSVRFWQRSVALLLLWAVGLAGLGARGAPVLARPADDAEPAFTGYLPLVFRQRTRTPFGMESIWLNSSNVDLVRGVNPYWLRLMAFDWNQIEPTLESPRLYRWQKVNEQSLVLASNSAVNVIATIKYTPAWAQKMPGTLCGPIREDTLDEFASFLEALVTRYSQSPYNIRYWELGNEPDVSPYAVPADNVYGCWGDHTDPYYGGGYYAEMLKHAYPAIKRADPEAQVMIGGLLLKCDPDDPESTLDCSSARFFEGILRNQGGAYFDIVAFHSYAHFDNGTVFDERHGNWRLRGGMVSGKAAFLREVMARYGVVRPLLMNEVALACPNGFQGCTPPGDAFFEAQADYILTVNARAWGEDLLGAVWYSLDDTGWNYVALNTLAGPRPAYRALKFMATELYEARLSKPVYGHLGIKGYEYLLADRRAWLVWSSDGQSHPLTLPAGTVRVMDKYGTVLQPQGGQVSVTSPIYLEIGP